jgi:hypothetical protein
MAVKRGGTNRVDIGLKKKGREPINKTRQNVVREKARQGQANTSEGSWTDSISNATIHRMVMCGSRLE